MIYIWLFLLFAAAMIFVFRSWKKIRFDHYYYLTTKAFIFRMQKKEERAFFSSQALQCALQILLRHKNKAAAKALRNLTKGDSRAAECYLLKHGEDFAAGALRMMRNPSGGLRILEKSDDFRAKAEILKLYSLQGQKELAEQIVESLPECKKFPYVRACKKFFEAQSCLTAGNMADASLKAGAAITLFRQTNAFTEEADAYLLAGTIYRLSAVEDTAYFMLKQARDIFAAVGHYAGEAEALGNLGMLWTMRENFEEAENCFSQSLEICKKYNRETAAAYIIDQTALLKLLQKQYALALKLAQEALQIHISHENKKGEAFSRDILAYVYAAQKQWKESAEQAELAEKLYIKEKDTAAYFSSLYQQAQAAYELKEDKKAEQKLRQIIQNKERDNCCFHSASAISLLGLIFLRKNQLKRAKSLFLQAASLEQKNERFSGAATDYTNIGLIEYKSGDKKQALKTFYTALEYASAFGENEFSQMLEQKIKNLENELK